MALKCKLTYSNIPEVHFVKQGQTEFTLCGEDLTEGGEYTKEKVTCKACISIVRYCKNKIALNECLITD